MKAWCYLKAHPNYKVKIDSEDLDRVSEYSWRVTQGTTGRNRVVTSYREGKKVLTMTLGRFLMKPKNQKQVYPRRFNDSLDYRKENLVVCTLQERQQLLPKRRSGSSSRFKGVSYIKAQGTWRAGISVEGISISLGDFNSEDEAALAYNKAAKKHFAGFAYQNNISRPTKSRKGEK
ncbi:MAG: AP2 domain-containing protein [Pseudomonadota bacterium]|nr:AP2 domain-containing protein [Pseudomonadota bacterium]